MSTLKGRGGGGGSLEGSVGRGVPLIMRPLNSDLV